MRKIVGKINMAHLQYSHFNAIDLSDPFFDSLKADYAEFAIWFNKKAASDEHAYVLYDDEDKLVAFLYLKLENDEIKDAHPTLPYKKRLKVGTLKIEAHGTRLGERVIKKIMDHATENNVEEIYVTIFPKHERLIKGLNNYGFYHVADKISACGTELVLIKNIGVHAHNIYQDYPFVEATRKKCWVLSIKPEFHTKMFPDSILSNESYNLLNDVAPTNTIRKIYITAMNCLAMMSKGDLVFIYRTKDGQGPAYYRSVVTSMCVVDEVRNINHFKSESDFLLYCSKGSIFSVEELKQFYKDKNYPHLIRMTYNVAFKKKVTNQQLQEELEISPSYWGCFSLTSKQSKGLLDLGRCNPNLVVWEQ